MKQKVYIDEDFIIQYCKEQTNKFINEASWNHSFENEFPCYLGSEASALSQMLFARLLGEAFDHADMNYTSKMEVGEVKMSLDIMNNPNPSKRDFYRLGSRAKRFEIVRLNEWVNIKYTIGNFTPIPNSNGNKRMRHLQMIHNNQNERWDFLLKYLKDNWNNYSSELFPEFADYMIKTAQHIYFEKIFMDLQNKLENRDINQVRDDEWLKWVEEWNDILKDKNNDLKLHCFGIKTTEEENIDDIIRDICWLIEIRGRLIMALLKANSKKS